MRKKALILAAIFSAFSTVAYAQQQQQAPSYSQQVQKLFDQTNNQARTQFDKKYPKPVAPKIESLPPANTGTYKPPVAPKAYEQKYPQTLTQTAQAPDVAISPNDKTEKKEGPAVNIFSPPGNTNTNQHQSAPNPYR